MFSAKKNSESGRNWERETECSGLTINLTVRGSPAPTCLQQPKILAECKDSKRTPKERRRKELPFPVEKIIYLAERLQLTSLTEKKVEAVALTAVDVEERISTGNHRREKRTRRDERFGFSPRGFDFSLDLSSISNAGDASDGCCDDFEEGTSSSVRRGGISFGSPCSDEEVCETSRVPSISRGSFSEVDGGVFRDCECAEPEVSARNRDLVHLYVNSVENQEELVKYFRPCRSCEEICCICSDSSFGVRRSERPHPKNLRDGPRNFGRISKAVDTDVKVTGFECECPSPSRRFRDSECCFSRHPDTEFFSPFYGGGCIRTCKCRCEPSNSASDDSLRSVRIHGYASSLARATQSARDLVKDLELILSGLDGVTG